MKPTEEELITYVKPILKSEGFKKKGKRWTKVTEHFTYIFTFYLYLFYSGEQLR